MHSCLCARSLGVFRALLMFDWFYTELLTNKHLFSRNESCTSFEFNTNAFLCYSLLLYLCEFWSKDCKNVSVVEREKIPLIQLLDIGTCAVCTDVFSMLALVLSLLAERPVVLWIKPGVSQDHLYPGTCLQGQRFFSGLVASTTEVKMLLNKMKANSLMSLKKLVINCLNTVDVLHPENS